MKKPDLLACQLKYQGKSNAEIREAVMNKKGSPKEGTVANWFARGGRLHDAYLQHEEEENDRRKREAHNIYRRNVRAAVGQVLRIMAEGESDTVKLKAAVDVLDRLFGKPTQTQEVKGDIMVTETLQRLDELVKKAEDEVKEKDGND